MARRGRGRQNIQYEEAVQEPNKLSHLQPELLTEDVLKDILRERGVSSSSMHQMNKDELAGLFYKHVTPKPQRDLRENRRGKLLMKVRKKRERIIKDDDYSSKVGGFKGNTRVSATSVGNQNNVASRVPLVTSGLVNSALPSTAERLKPPPSCINPGRKTIKLGGGSSTPSLNIVDRKTVNLSSSSTSSSSGNMPQKKVIKLSGTSSTPSLDRLGQSGGDQRTPSRPGSIYAQYSQPDYAYGHHCDRDRANSEERHPRSQSYRIGERLNNQDSEVSQRSKTEIRSKLKLDRRDRNYRELSESKEQKVERKRKHSRESNESDVSSDEEARAKKWKHLQKSFKKKKKKHKKRSESEKEKHTLEELERRKKKKSKKKRKLSEGSETNPEVVVIESDSECERKKKKSKKKKKKREHSH